MKSPFDVAKRYLETPDQRAAEPVPTERTADPTEGRIIAVKICSHVLDACIWLAFDDGFKPDEYEPLAIFYADEIPLLKDKTPDQLREIHKVKLTFGPRAMVRQ